jgi:hypothetical protein
VEDAAGERKTVVMQGDACTVRARVRFHAPVEDPEFRIAWVNDDRQNSFVVSNRVDGNATGRFEPGDDAEVAVAFDNSLRPGRYFLSMVVARPGGGQDQLDRWERMFSVVVVGSRATGGLVDLPHRLTVQRRPAAAERASP